MTSKIIWMVGLVAAIFAADTRAADQPAPPPFPAWDNFVDGLKPLGPALLGRLPDRLRNDPQVQQEVGRLLLEAIASRTIDAIGADGDHPVFLPSVNVTLNIGQPNADTVYKSASITPGGVFRLRGTAGSLRIVKIGQFGPSEPGKGIVPLAYDDVNKLNIDKNGNFDVILSPVRPPSYEGDWWPLNPRTNMLLLRQVAYDWSVEHDPRISIERLDAPVERPRPDAAALEKRLRDLPKQIEGASTLLFDHVEGLRKDGYLNRLKVFDVSHLGGLVGQFYYEGAYELLPDEALIVEAKVPDQCSYSSMILTNDLYETTDWYNNESSLNGSQVHVDRDGILRIVVSAKDPGIRNWLDTAGYPSGVIQGRWTDCSSTPVPSVKKVAFADLRKSLPAETPVVSSAERDRIVRDRRAYLQQRPLW